MNNDFKILVIGFTGILMRTMITDNRSAVGKYDKLISADGNELISASAVDGGDHGVSSGPTSIDPDRNLKKSVGFLIHDVISGISYLNDP